MSNPLTAIDALVIGGLRDSPALAAAMGGRATVFAYDSEYAVWDERQRPAGLDAWCWVLPEQSECDLLASSGAARLVRRYRVGVARAGRGVELLRACEWAVMRAVLTLCLRLRPDGGGAIRDPAPARLVDVTVGASDPQRDTAELPDGWSDVCVVSVSADVAHADMEVHA